MINNINNNMNNRDDDSLDKVEFVSLEDNKELSRVFSNFLNLFHHEIHVKDKKRR